jgi:hypothetical protein
MQYSTLIEFLVRNIINNCRLASPIGTCNTGYPNIQDIIMVIDIINRVVFTNDDIVMAYTILFRDPSIPINDENCIKFNVTVIRSIKEVFSGSVIGLLLFTVIREWSLISSCFFVIRELSITVIRDWHISVHIA